MSKFKVGDKVRVVKVELIAYARNDYYNGMETKVNKVSSNGVYLLTKNKENGVYITEEEIEKGAIELIKDKKNKEKIKSLEKSVEEQQNEINELKVLVHQLRDNTTIVVKEDVKSNNELLVDVIEKAKLFVEKHKEYGPGSNWKELKVDTVGHCYAEFIVNKEKRVVVALIKSLYADLITLKGIAKCMPSDVFNEHIGKAIALGRALGIDVSEFENAVQPDSIVLGMFVKDKNVSFIEAGGRVCKLKKGAFGSPGYENENGVWNSFQYTEIIDDTNAIYDEVK